LPRDGKNLTEISATLATGDKTAANIALAAKLTLRPRSSNARSNWIEGRNAMSAQPPTCCTLWKFGAF
jgi:hypothetical protein